MLKTHLTARLHRYSLVFSRSSGNSLSMASTTCHRTSPPSTFLDMLHHTIAYSNIPYKPLFPKNHQTKTPNTTKIRPVNRFFLHQPIENATHTAKNRKPSCINIQTHPPTNPKTAHSKPQMNGQTLIPKKRPTKQRETKTDFDSKNQK